MLEVLPSSDAHNNSRRQVRKNDQDGTKRTKRDRSTSALSPTKPPSKTTRALTVAAATAAASPTKKVATLEDSNSNSNARRRRRHRPGAKDNGTSKGARTKSSKAAASTPLPPPLELSLEEQERYIAMDCEMVGVGPYGTESALARVTLLNWQGQVVLDAWVRPAQPVTDYRTFVSGITPQDLTDETSPHVLLELDTCRNLVRQQIANKIVIGHALKNDFHALQIYDHPWYLQRDTAKYEPFLQKQDNNNNPAATSDNKSANGSSSSSSCGSSSSSDEATPAFSSSSYYSYNDWHVRRPKARKLKDLVQEKLHRTIQPPGAVHSPIEDALGALDLYKLVRVKWEKCMAYKIAKTQEILLSQHHHYQQQQQTTLFSSSVEKSNAMLASDHDEVATAASTSQSEDSTFEADYEEFPAEIPVLVVTDNDDNNNNNNDEDDDDEEEDNQDDDDEQLLC